MSAMEEKQTPRSPGESRRELLKRSLRAAIYVPPTILAMSMRNVSVAQATCTKFLPPPAKKCFP